MTTYTTQPDATDGIDTRIDSANATTNYATDVLTVGEVPSVTQIFRTLLKFNLAVGTNPPPATALVSSATLYLTPTYDGSSNARTMSAYRVIRAWSESQATWNVYTAGNNWGTAGCANTTTDRESAALGTMAVSASPTGGVALTMSLDITKVQEWISGAFANNGMLLQVDTETDDQIDYASSDNATASYRPKLVIEYTNGGGFMMFSS
jgi:hypothetical protein